MFAAVPCKANTYVDSLCTTPTTAAKKATTKAAYKTTKTAYQTTTAAYKTTRAKAAYNTTKGGESFHYYNYYGRRQLKDSTTKAQATTKGIL